MANEKTNAINAAIFAEQAATSAAIDRMSADLAHGLSMRNAVSEIHKANAEIERLDGLAIHWMDVAQFRGDAAAERIAINAGLRAVIRYALTELRKTDSNNPMLDKKVRDRIYAQFEAEELKKLQEGRVKDGRPQIKSRVPEERYSE